MNSSRRSGGGAAGSACRRGNGCRRGCRWCGNRACCIGGRRFSGRTGRRGRPRGGCIFVTAEICHIPAGALELKAGGGHLFFELRFSAARAIGKGVVRHLLEHVLGKSASVAFVGVNRHGVVASSSRVAKPLIISCSRYRCSCPISCTVKDPSTKPPRTKTRARTNRRVRRCSWTICSSNRWVLGSPPLCCR